MNMTSEAAAGLVASTYRAEHPAGEVDVATVMSRGETRRRRRRNTSVAALAGSASLAVVLATVAAPAVLQGGAGAVSPSSRTEAATEQLSLLGRPATEADRAPALGEDADVLDDRTMLPSSARLLTVDDGVSYYAGTSRRGDVCIMVGSGSACVPVAEFAETGVWLGESIEDADSPEEGTWITTLLLPDSKNVGPGTDPAELVRQANTPSREGDEVDVVSPNLIVVNPSP